MFRFFVTCLPVFGPIIAGKFQFSGMCDSGRWTRKDHEEIEVYGGADCLHPAALPVNRSTYQYRSRRAGQAHLSERIREIATTRVRYGYRRIHVLLRRDRWRVNPKRVYRLYREMGLQLRNKTPKRRVKAKLREDRQSATRPNETWAMDFVHDQLATGRKLRVLTIIDTFSRFSPAIEPRFTFRGPDVVEILEEVGRQ